ncbi:MAG: Slp family lipoprotein [Desulfuromonadales bacterium]|nr:Slp family lipoprotein [Desulfuromonadales bacterium]
MRHFMLWLLLLWPATGLAASPVPTEIYAEVDHALRPAKVLATPEAYLGRTLLLGGVVERTVSEPGNVLVEIVCYNLTDDDRPVQPDPVLGRVLISGSELDGAILQPGRLLTLVGEVVGRGQSDTGALPLLKVKFIHHWPTAEEEAEREAARRYYRPYNHWCDPWYYDPWCDPWYYGPYPRWHFGAGYYRHWH